MSTRHRGDETHQRIMLAATVRRGGEEIVSAIGLNDAVIAASGALRIIRLEVNLTPSYLGRYRADGLIVATSMGFLQSYDLAGQLQWSALIPHLIIAQNQRDPRPAPIGTLELGLETAAAAVGDQPQPG